MDEGLQYDYLDDKLLDKISMSIIYETFYYYKFP